jgi:hypothetical protein
LEMLCPNYVAWTMLDGCVMAGQIVDSAFGTLHVRRVDGGMCSIAASKTHPATCDEVDEACRFFAMIGR